MANAPAASAQTEPVYSNSLAAGWQNWSWSSTVNFANSSQFYGASGTSLSVQYTQAWAGLYLHSNAIIDAATHVKLRFAIRGSTVNAPHLQVTAYDASSNAGTQITVSPPGTTWTVVEIPTTSFNVTQISGLTWQDTTGAVQPVYYLDNIEWVLGSTPPGPGPAINVDASHFSGRISPYIYGINFASAALAGELQLPVRRWGGNGTTRYNYQLDTSNHAMDWYFENIPDGNSNPGALPNDSNADKFVDQDRSTGTATLLTVPTIGWTPKSRAYACGFSVAKYGSQQSTDPYRPDCGNGIKPDGSKVSGNDPTDTSLAIGPSFVQGWIAHLISRYGTATQGGVKFYNLDNEPMLWNDTHRDVHPQPTSYDEMRDRTYQYASAIKAADPTALTVGPAEWGWTGYFYSALDAAPGGAWWNNPQDRNAHGGIPFTDWYLQQMRTYEQTNGVRILDYLDLHCYPQNGVALTTAGDASRQALRLRSTRSLWDPAYVDESWIGEAVRMVPRMRDWVNTNYPGTKIAITEYNWGGLESINGALAQADVLGIFGREGLDLATLWDPPGDSQPGAYAFRIFRNYDGAGGKFGDRSVLAVSANQSQVSVYAARTADNRLTVILINKQTQSSTSVLTLSGVWPSGPAQVYRYSSANVGAIVRDVDLALPGGPVSITLPASSMALLVIPGQQAPADLDSDGDVDDADFTALKNCRSRSGLEVTSGCSAADLDGDGDSDLNDFARFQRCYAGTDVAVNPACGE